MQIFIILHKIEKQKEMSKQNTDNISYKLQRYCLYQARCYKDVQIKYKQLNGSPEEEKSVLASLEEEGFFDDLSYAKAFAYGKFTHNQWGKQKIRMGLIAKGIESPNIENALDEICQNAYIDCARSICLNKLKSIKSNNKKELLSKVYNFMIQRGFYSDDFIPYLKENLNKLVTCTKF